MNSVSLVAKPAATPPLGGSCRTRFGSTTRECYAHTSTGDTCPEPGGGGNGSD